MKLLFPTSSKIFCLLVSLLLLGSFPEQAYALIGNGANAMNVAGQLNSAGAISYLKGGFNSGPNTQGFNFPYDAEVDAVNHRLFVSDYYNFRVLVFNLNTSNLLVDYTADNVLGQADFDTAAIGVSQSGFSLPAGLAYDSANQRLFVADLLANRVLVFDVNAIANGENAQNVLGQANFTSNGLATTQAGLGSPRDLAYDNASNRLFVVDTRNNRVMVFDVNSITNGENAVSVLGQTDFTSNASTTTQSGLTYPYFLTYDSGGNRLFVADSDNHRVMVFDVAAITNGENAVNVLGQANFTSNGLATTQSGFNAPQGLAYDSAGSRLFVVDTNHRVMVFEVAAITNGENAVNVLGQANFTALSAGAAQTTFLNPMGVTYDSGSGQLFVADSTNHRVMVFDVAAITNGESATNVLGQLDPTPAISYVKGAPNNGPFGIGFNQPADMAIDTANHRLFVSDADNHRVLVFNLTSSDTLTDYTADFVLGTSDLVTFVTFLPSGVPVSQSSLFYPQGLAYDSAGSRLFVADRDHNRIMVFDVASISNGENAVNVLGQADFTSNTVATTQSGFYSPQDLSFDSANQRLFVADSSNNRVMVFDVTSITNGENAVSVLGQTNFTTATSGLTQNNLNYPDGLAYDSSNQRFFVSDSNNNRVMVFDVNFIANGENAQNVLGQANFTTNTAATTQSGLFFPRGLAYNNSLGYLLVSAAMSHRVIFFDVSASITNGEAAVIVLGQSNFTDAVSRTSQSGFSHPQGLFINPANGHLWVADANNNRVLVFDTQFGPGSTGFTGGSSYQAPKSPDPAPSPDESIPSTPPSSSAPSEPAPQKPALPEAFSLKPALPNPFIPQPAAPKPASPKLIPQNLFFFGFPRGK